MKEIPQTFLDESVAAFRSYKKLAERAFEQISDEEFFRLIDAESNSIALIVKHIGGNLRSRWTDFLTTDGEKPDRRRDAEFAKTGDTREGLMQGWETGWQILFDSHATYHVGQITFLAKHFRAEEWKTLSIPKNKSAAFNDWLGAEKDKENYLEATRDFTKKDLSERRE